MKVIRYSFYFYTIIFLCTAIAFLIFTRKQKYEHENEILMKLPSTYKIFSGPPISIPRMRFWFDDKIKMQRTYGKNDSPGKEGTWQNVYGTKDKFYVYAAYVEYRMVAGVRVIAAVARESNESVACLLWLPDNTTVTVPAKIRVLADNGSLKYSGAFVMCLLTDTKVDVWSTIHGYVSVISTSIKPENQYVLNKLRVKDTRPLPELDVQEKIHICLKPIHSQLDDGQKILEWILFNQLLGVSHFYMYNRSIGLGTEMVINYFKDRGMVTVLPWKLPLDPKKEIREDLVAYHDCLYRSMHDASWLLILDLDEFLLPRVKINLLDYIATNTILEKTKKTAALVFRSAFFYTFHLDDPEARNPLLTCRKTQRQNQSNDYKKSEMTKFMVRPSKAIELKRHSVREFIPGDKNLRSLFVREDLALVHHYRNSCYKLPLKKCSAMATSVDRTAFYWTDELWHKVVVTMQDIHEQETKKRTKSIIFQ